MNPTIRCMCLIALALGATCAQAQAPARDLRGTTPGGASYLIRVPAGWQAGGPLVVVNRGYSLGPDEVPNAGPLVDLQLAQGYAVAASGFRTAGWTLFDALDDNAELLATFRSEVGEPGQLIAAGGSMGGLISLRMTEDARFAPRMAGVYALCPPADGLRAWDTGFDLRMVYDATCDGVGGGELLTGSTPPPWALDLADIPLEVDLTDRNDPAVRTLARITQCTGVTLPPGLRSSAQRDRLARIQGLSGIRSEDFLLLNLGYAVFGMSELLRAPDKLAGAIAFDNRQRAYARALPAGDPRAADIDARVLRVAGDPFARLRLAHASRVNGLGSAPIVSLHTDGDGLVQPWHQHQLRLAYAGAGSAPLLQALVVEDEDTHCGFQRPELEAGWDVLRGWIASGSAPDVDRLQARCLALGGSATTCRFSAAASTPAALPRPPDTDATPASRVAKSGFWFDPRRDGEGLVIEELDAPVDAREDPQRRRVVVGWYTYAPGATGAGAQRWITGLGVAHGNGVVVENAELVSGGRFGDARPVTRTPFGRLDLVFEDGPGTAGGTTARLRWRGPAAWGGQGELALQRLAWPGSGLTAVGEQALVPPPARGAAGRSGLWFDPQRDGQGLVLHQQLAPGGGPARSFLAVFSFDADGAPLWLLGVDGVSGGGRIVFDAVTTTRGARFDAFDPARVERLRWGRIELETAGCALTALAWQADDPRLGSGRMPLQRIAAPPRDPGACTPD
jgi:hypothetical protein